VNLLKHLHQTIGQLFKQLYLLPQAIANVAKLRQQRISLNDLEAERLDRIRNPERYRGK